MVDLADHTAATTAGYKRIQIDRGAASSPRYVSTYEKQLIGEPCPARCSGLPHLRRLAGCR